MAAKKKASKPKTLFNTTFVNYKMDKPTKKKFDDWYSEVGDSLPKLIHEILEVDYKISFSYDANNDCIVATMTGRDESLNPNKCLTMRSKDWYKALAAVVFVHEVVFSGELWEVEEDNDIV